MWRKEKTNGATTLTLSLAVAALILFCWPKKWQEGRRNHKAKKVRKREGGIQGKPLLSSSLSSVALISFCWPKTLAGREEVLQGPKKEGKGKEASVGSLFCCWWHWLH